MSKLPQPNQNISGEDYPWKTGIICGYDGCDGEILCWVQTTKNSKAYFYYKCFRCDEAGSWAQLARRKVGSRRWD